MIVIDMILILILIPIVFIIIYVFNNNIEKETEKYTHINNIYFMSQLDTVNFLRNDTDNYVKNLTKIDLYARKVKNYKEYLNNIERTCISFTEEEKIKLNNCVRKANSFFENIDFNKIAHFKRLNGDDINIIPWIFALTCKINTLEYEEGLPHTRDNIIFLSKNIMNYNDIDLVNTLIHEKIHIYQRYNKKLFGDIIYNMNYYIIDDRFLKNKEYIRSNPDIDENIYFDKTANKENTCLYRSDKPSGINDIIITNFSIEHPYERIAYEIAQLYYTQNANKYKDV